MNKELMESISSLQDLIEQKTGMFYYESDRYKAWYYNEEYFIMDKNFLSVIIYSKDFIIGLRHSFDSDDDAIGFVESFINKINNSIEEYDFVKTKDGFVGRVTEIDKNYIYSDTVLSVDEHGNANCFELIENIEMHSGDIEDLYD